MLAVLMTVGAMALVGCNSGPKPAANASPNSDNKVAALPLAPPASVVGVGSLPPGSGDMTAVKTIGDPAPQATTPSPARVHRDAAKPAKLVKKDAAGAGKYTVKKGDSLSKIAKLLYGDSKKYKEIAMANNITNPNKIRVGQVLVIP